jgi:hypothetical protein
MPTVQHQQSDPARLATTLQIQLCSTADGYARIRWTVDARKLKGSDKQLVSPPFNVDLGMRLGPAVFKVLLKASGSSTFKRSLGFGCVQVKCASELDDDACTKVRVIIGSEGRAQLPRGPLTHCFSSNPVFTLPEEWNFCSAAEQQSNAMVVNIDIAPLV